MKKHSMQALPFVSKAEGFITLLAVLIVSAIAITITASLLLLGIGSSRTSFALEQSNQAKALVNACAEEALQQINDSSNFSGTGNLNLGQGDCSYEVVDDGGQNRTVTATGTVDDVVRRVRITLDSVNPTISVVRWEEVGAF